MFYEFNKKGMTLTELLVATALMGVVMLGVASVDYAVRGAEKKSSANAILAITASGILIDIAKNAGQATGDQSNSGIHDSTASFHELCFREDKNSPITTDTYSDDSWKCYLHDPALHTIESCTVASVPNGNSAACISAADHQLLTANVVAFTSTFVSNPTPPNTAFSIQLSLTLRKNASQAIDPMNNPQVTLTSDVVPMGHSW